MQYFLDTSALVKRYVNEVGTPWVQRCTIPRAGQWNSFPHGHHVMDQQEGELA